MKENESKNSDIAGCVVAVACVFGFMVAVCIKLME